MSWNRKEKRDSTGAKSLHALSPERVVGVNHLRALTTLDGLELVSAREGVLGSLPMRVDPHRERELLRGVKVSRKTAIRI